VRDPSKPASKTKQYAVMAAMWTAWDVAFFFGSGHILVGAVALLLPLAYLVLARRASAR